MVLLNFSAAKEIVRFPLKLRGEGQKGKVN